MTDSGDNLYFEEVKGEPQLVIISGLLKLGKNGLPEGFQDHFDLTIDFQ